MDNFCDYCKKTNEFIYPDFKVTSGVEIQLKRNNFSGRLEVKHGLICIDCSRAMKNIVNDE